MTYAYLSAPPTLTVIIMEQQPPPGLRGSLGFRFRPTAIGRKLANIGIHATSNCFRARDRNGQRPWMELRLALAFGQRRPYNLARTLLLSLALQNFSAPTGRSSSMEHCTRRWHARTFDVVNVKIG